MAGQDLKGCASGVSRSIGQQLCVAGFVRAK